MPPRITPFLMFEGKAEEAMRYYTSVFPGSEIERIERYDADEPGAAGMVKQAIFRLNDQRFMCIDSPVHHAFTFTAAMSLFVDCQTEAEVDRIFALLSDGGAILMPIGSYPFSQRFVWLTDRFGVSWQLNLVQS